MEMTDPYHADAVASYECLWQFRRRVVSWWPPPDRDDSIRLAVTEAAEALDAWLRLHRPQYARNHDRLNGGEEAILFELTDCAMMLLTALGGDEDNAPEECGGNGRQNRLPCHGTTRVPGIQCPEL